MTIWLQHDLSIFGRVLLTKAEGISRIVYSALSVFVPELTSKKNNKRSTFNIQKRRWT